MRGVASVVDEPPPAGDVGTNGVEIAFTEVARVDQSLADADRDRPGLEIRWCGLEVDVPGRHQRDVRQRALHVREVARRRDSTREHLDDVGAGAPGRQDLGRRQAADECRVPRLVGDGDDIRLDRRADDEVDAGPSGGRRVGTGQDGAGTDPQAIGPVAACSAPIASIAPGVVSVTSIEADPTVEEEPGHRVDIDLVAGADDRDQAFARELGDQRVRGRGCPGHRLPLVD